MTYATSIERLKDRASIAVRCLPEAPYREHLTKLHAEIFAELDRLEQEPGIQLTEAMIDAACEVDAEGEAIELNRRRFAEAGVKLEKDFATAGQIFAIQFREALAAGAKEPTQ
jgi:hypothetical protein